MRKMLTLLKLFGAVLLTASALHGQQVAGSGEVRANATGGNCNQNSKCAARVSMKATLPLDSNVTGVIYLTTSGGPGGDVPLRGVTAGGDYGWSRMDPAIPIIDLKNNTVTYEAAFYNRSSNRARIAAITVSYTQPRTTKTFETSSGYVLVPPTGKACKDNTCATTKTLQAIVPKNATVTATRYFTSGENGPGDDDAPLHEVQAGECAWCFIQPAVPKTNPYNPNTLSYETIFFNRSSDRTREAAIVVDYTMP